MVDDDAPQFFPPTEVLASMIDLIEAARILQRGWYSLELPEVALRLGQAFGLYHRHLATDPTDVDAREEVIRELAATAIIAYSAARLHRRRALDAAADLPDAPLPGRG